VKPPPVQFCRLAGDVALQRGGIELICPSPARRQLDVKAPRRDRVERSDQLVRARGAPARRRDTARRWSTGRCRTRRPARCHRSASPRRDAALVTGLDVQRQRRLLRPLLPRRVARPLQLAAETPVRIAAGWKGAPATTDWPRTDRRAGCGLRFLQECVSAGGGREHECGREDRNDLSQYR
jgi:hypothetical protein